MRHADLRPLILPIIHFKTRKCTAMTRRACHRTCALFDPDPVITTAPHELQHYTIAPRVVLGTYSVPPADPCTDLQAYRTRTRNIHDATSMARTGLPNRDDILSVDMRRGSNLNLASLAFQLDHDRTKIGPHLRSITFSIATSVSPAPSRTGSQSSSVEAAPRLDAGGRAKIITRCIRGYCTMGATSKCWCGCYTARVVKRQSAAHKYVLKKTNKQAGG